MYSHACVGVRIFTEARRAAQRLEKTLTGPVRSAGRVFGCGRGGVVSRSRPRTNRKKFTQGIGGRPGLGIHLKKQCPPCRKIR